MINKPKRATITSNLLSIIIMLIAVFGGMLIDTRHIAPPKAPALSNPDLFCLVQNIYHEARGESPYGQPASPSFTPPIRCARSLVPDGSRAETCNRRFGSP